MQRVKVHWVFAPQPFAVTSLIIPLTFDERKSGFESLSSKNEDQRPPRRPPSARTPCSPIVGIGSGSESRWGFLCQKLSAYVCVIIYRRRLRPSVASAIIDSEVCPV